MASAGVIALLAGSWCALGATPARSATPPRLTSDAVVTAVSAGHPADEQFQAAGGSTDHAHIRLDLTIIGSTVVSASDVSFSAQLDAGSGPVSTPVALRQVSAGVVSVDVGPNTGFDLPADGIVNIFVTFTVDAAARGQLNVNAALDEVDAESGAVSVADLSTDGSETVIPEPSPYLLAQVPVLDRATNASLYYATALRAGGGNPVQVQFGRSSDLRVTVDDGDGDGWPNVFRPSTGNIYQSNGGGGGFTAHRSAAGIIFPYQPGGSGYGGFPTGDTLLDGTVEDGSYVTGGYSDGTVAYDPATHGFLFINSPQEQTIYFGRSGDIPLLGNWNASSGIDMVGVYRPSTATFYLRLPNGTVITSRYGRVGDQPVVGDWDGSGTSLIGVRRGNTFYLATRNNEPTSRAPFSFGRASDRISDSAWLPTGADMEALAARD